jgi:signal transduction histidine kinase
MAQSADPPATIALPHAQIRPDWIVRAAWLATAAFILTLFLAGLPSEVSLLSHTCQTASCPSGQIHQFTPAEEQALHALGLSLGFFAGYSLVLDCVVAVIFGVTPVLLFWRRSNDRIALLTSYALLFGASALTSAPQALAVLHPFWRLPVTVATLFGNIAFVLFLYLFPDSRWAPRWMWIVAALWIARDVLRAVAPLSGLDEGTWPLWLQFPIFLGLFASVIYAQIYRYRRVSTPLQQSQTKWVVFGITLALGISIVVNTIAAIFAPTLDTPSSMLIALIGSSIIVLGFLAIPMFLSVALIRYQLFETDRILQRALVSGTLTAGIVGLYVGLVGALSLLFQNSGNAVTVILATGIVALLFQPLRERLQLGVSRLLYGRRDEPYAVMAGLNRRLEAALAPEDVLPTIVATVAQALKLPYVALALKQGEEYIIGAMQGAPADELEHFPLTYQGASIGELQLAPRSPGESFTPADRQLLADLAREAGIAVYTVRQALELQRLNRELQRSRAQIIAAREEERRRLRRDLHDGLGSALTSATYKLAAARNVLDRDLVTAATLLDEVKDQTQAAIADIRHIVYDLRPPALDELGFVAALDEHVGHSTLNGMQVAFDAPDDLPGLSAAAEVAAYRIVTEGFANAIKHAHARHCTIRLGVSADSLTLDVQDDGIGLPPDYHPGVGLAAMRERAAELGGTLKVKSIVTGGTLVQATLPLGKEE